MEDKLVVEFVKVRVIPSRQLWGKEVLVIGSLLDWRPVESVFFGEGISNKKARSSALSLQGRKF